ncbi:unnamed protein product [Adineta steineri]|uniref:VHS domain-containing protein n=1 Tax=Adineta steineri TaxID=433720 RepID=A0A813TSW1_9BILA|nr:unnamed protein product [Adineta steineri]CAF4059483.1 unnamed protein product [Adineta steineri]
MDRTYMTGTSSWLQQAIEQATDPTQTVEDWSLIMKICDDVAIDQDSAREAIQLIKKNLQIKLSNQEWRSITLTLTLLEALVKNCGKIVHIEIANEGFLRALKAIIPPKNNPPLPIEEQVLGMIQYWTFAFGDEPGFEIIRELYQVCKEQHFKFPPADEQHVIQTSLSTEIPAKNSAALSRTISQSSSRSMTRPKTAMPSYNRTDSVDADQYQHDTNTSPVIRHLPDEQIAKLRSELDLVHINLDVFEEMIAKLKPGYEHAEDWQLFTKKPLDTDDNDSDSKQTVEELKRPSTGRKSLPTNRGSLSTVEYNVSHGNLSERRSNVPTRNSETQEHDDQSILPMKLRNIKLAPLPDAVPRSTTKATSVKRAMSAAGSIKINRNQEKIQISDYQDDSSGFDEHNQNRNAEDQPNNETSVTGSEVPLRVKRLTTSDDNSADGNYKITQYRYVTSDAKK